MLGRSVRVGRPQEYCRRHSRRPFVFPPCAQPIWSAAVKGQAQATPSAPGVRVLTSATLRLRAAPAPSPPWLRRLRPVGGQRPPPFGPVEWRGHSSRSDGRWPCPKGGVGAWCADSPHYEETCYDDEQIRRRYWWVNWGRGKPHPSDCAEQFGPQSA